MNLKEKKEKLASLIAEAKKADSAEVMESQIAEIKSLKAEVESGEAIEKAESFLNEPAEAKSGFYIPAKTERRAKQSIGQAFVESDEYKSAAKGTRGSGLRVSVEVPTEQKDGPTINTVGDFNLTAGMTHLPGIVQPNLQPLSVVNLLSRGTTNLSAVPYLVENSFTNAAAGVEEGGLKPSAAFDVKEEIAPVRKIAVIAKVSDEMFADYSAMQSYVDGRLRYMVGAEEEDQVLNGDGLNGNLKGILGTTGIQTQDTTGETLADAIHKGITKIRANAFLEPDAIVINPTDWETLRLSKDDNDTYYAGGPFSPLAGMQIWGVPVVVTSNITAGTVLVGNFRLGAQAFYKSGVTVDATNSDGDDFSYNRMTVRVEERLALAVFRPAAFCKVADLA